MFRREDNLIVTQTEHSRLSGALALLLGEYLEQSVEKLAGAIAIHDWPHFGGSHADVIEIGKKTAAQQQELLDRLSREIPVDPFTELIMRRHWKMLSGMEQARAAQNAQSGESVDTEAADSNSTLNSVIALHSEFNEDRIGELMRKLELSEDLAKRYSAWTRCCDGMSFYVSRGQGAQRFVVPDLERDDRAWEFWFRFAEGEVSVTRVLVGDRNVGAIGGQRVDLKSLETQLSLLAYESDGYPHRLSPVMQVLRCKFGS